MNIENGKYVYFGTARYSVLRQHDDGSSSIEPAVFQFKLVSSARSEFDFDNWLNSMFAGKLILEQGHAESSTSLFSSYFKDFLYVENISIDYITEIIYTILCKTYPDQKIEAISYQTF